MNWFRMDEEKAFSAGERYEETHTGQVDKKLVQNTISIIKKAQDVLCRLIHDPLGQKEWGGRYFFIQHEAQSKSLIKA